MPKVVWIAFLGLWLLGSPAAAADKYGAIAYNFSTGASGFSHDYHSRDGAEERALDECGNGCEVVAWVKNSCAALAIGDDGWGWGRASSRAEAEKEALFQCGHRTDGCEVKVWVCSG